MAAKKRKASQVDEEDGENEVQTPVKAKKARKSKVNATDDKVDSETNTNNPRSALALDSDDNKSTPSKHPTTLNASSSDAAENDAGAWLALVNSASVRTLATVAPAAHTTIATTSMRSRVDPTREWSRPRRAAGWLVKVSLLSP